MRARQRERERDRQTDRQRERVSMHVFNVVCCSVAVRRFVIESGYLMPFLFDIIIEYYHGLNACASGKCVSR